MTLRSLTCCCRLFLPGLITAVLAMVAGAVEPGFHADGYLLNPGTEPKRIEILEANPQTVVYREPDLVLSPTGPVTVELKNGTSIFVCEPPAYTKALDLFQGRKYADALAKFIEVKTLFKPVESLEDSYPSLAAYYEMECLRKMGNLDGLAPALQHFPKGPLTRESQRRQLELSVFWEAVRTKDWGRLDKMAREHAAVRLTSAQRAQVAYCHGLALEGLGRAREALLQYNIAITSDAGASEEVARPASLRILEIYNQDPEVVAALESISKSGVVPAKGQTKVAQAFAVAALFQRSLGADAPLPDHLKRFLRPAQ